jgi:hypothetical protein
MQKSLKHPVVLNRETGELISPRGKAFAGAREYNGELDKTRLTCIHCFTAAMHHRNESRGIAGDNAYGWTSHFSTSPGGKDKQNRHSTDCIASVMTQDKDYDPDRIDHAKGFMIYLNLGQIVREFRNRAAPVIRGHKGRVIVTDSDLADRERISARTPDDFIKLIKSGYLDRVKDSKIVHHDHTLSWNQFFIRTGSKGDTSRWEDLSRRLIEGKQHPAMIHLDLKNQYPVIKTSHDSSRMRFRLQELETYHPETKHPITVIPLVQIRNEKIFDIFRSQHEFMVLATPRIYPDRTSQNVWFMDIPVFDPKKVASIDLRSITQEARYRAQVRSGSAFASAPA